MDAAREPGLESIARLWQGIGKEGTIMAKENYESRELQLEVIVFRLNVTAVLVPRERDS
jgi:hypothetical protein